MIAGITVLPARLTRVAPAGARTSAALPTCAKRAPFTTNDALSTGARPSPTITRAPSKMVMVDVGVCPSVAADHAAISGANAHINRCIGLLRAELYQIPNPRIPNPESRVVRHSRPGREVREWSDGPSPDSSRSSLA